MIRSYSHIITRSMESKSLERNNFLGLHLIGDPLMRIRTTCLDVILFISAYCVTLDKLGWFATIVYFTFFTPSFFRFFFFQLLFYQDLDCSECSLCSDNAAKAWKYSKFYITSLKKSFKFCKKQIEKKEKSKKEGVTNVK